MYSPDFKENSRPMLAHEITMIASGVWRQILLITPYWSFGLVAGSLVSVFLSHRITGKVSSLSGVGLCLPQMAVASFLGIVSPLCMFGTVPVITALGKKGLPGYLLVSFMISSVMLNPNLFFLTIVLGRNLATLRFLLTLVAGVVAGLLVRLFWGERELFCLNRFEDAAPGKKKKFLPDLLKAFRITAPYFLVGIILTALLDRYIPPEWVYGMFGVRRGLGVLFATTLSVPLYACGGGVIPLINAWLHAGMGSGDAMAFMLAGPATKINSLSAVKMLFGRRNFALYLAYCLGFAMIAGLLMEFLF